MWYMVQYSHNIMGPTQNPELDDYLQNTINEAEFSLGQWKALGNSRYFLRSISTGCLVFEKYEKG